MNLVSRILAPGLVAAEMEDAGQPVALHPEEESLVAKAAPKRRRDFALGRACARTALARLGHAEAVIGMDKSGAPLWPTGIVGSITHTSSYAAALAGDTKHFSGLGIDAERIGGVSEALWPRLFDAAERDHLMTLNSTRRQVIATLLFSAKEAGYKAWGIKGALAFRDMHVAPEDDGFAITRADETVRGRYAVQDDLMLTAVWF